MKPCWRYAWRVKEALRGLDSLLRPCKKRNNCRCRHASAYVDIFKEKNNKTTNRAREKKCLKSRGLFSLHGVNVADHDSLAMTPTSCKRSRICEFTAWSSLAPWFDLVVVCCAVVATKTPLHRAKSESKKRQKTELGTTTQLKATA